MADPLAVTFDVLATTTSRAAIDVLVNAIDSKHPEIVQGAVAALLERGTTRCQAEVIRRLPALPDAVRKRLEGQVPRLTGTLRQCLLHGDKDLRSNALGFVSSAECYDLVPTLLQILAHPDGPFADDACRSLRQLTTRLYEHLRAGAGRKPSLGAQRTLPQIHQAVVSALEEACNNFAQLSHGREAVECILALCDPDSAGIRKVLLQGGPECRAASANVLLTSKHPGVMRLLVEFMGQSFPNSLALEAFEQRTDLDFICYVLGAFPKQLSENQQMNFKQLVRVEWLRQPAIWQAVPPHHQEALVAFVQAVGIETPAKVAVQEWILVNGSVRGRIAAGRILETEAPDSVRGILRGSLESEDEDVQAWATSQLRALGVPQAIRLLIERLDSPLPAVREAARDELGSFNFELLLTIFEHLDETVGRRSGDLMRKIDPDWRPKLIAELASPIQRRRIRAARAAHALGLARDAQDGLVEMLSAAETLVRRTAAEVLGDVPTAEVVAALAAVLHDPSPRVREAAERSLADIHRAGLQVDWSSPSPPATSPNTQEAD